MTIKLHRGDMREVLSSLEKQGIRFDACVTDPPYSLSSITERFGGENAAPAKTAETGVYARSVRGFMGEAWDNDIAFEAATWEAVFRCLKPGAHLMAFGATRTYHRMASAIEQAGFIILDMIQWQYGSGMPHAHNLEKAARRSGRDDIEELAGGFHTALKPAQEPICLAIKPRRGTVLENFRRYGTGVLNIDDCRITVEGDAQGRWPANIIHDGTDEVLVHYPAKAGAKARLKGDEPSASGQGPFKRWERKRVQDVIDQRGSAARFFFSGKAKAAERVCRCPSCGQRHMGRTEKCCGVALDHHATVKPEDVMRWLVRLITPVDGSEILDPFAGTGTTGVAALLEGQHCTMIEQDDRHVEDIRFRFSTHGVAL